METITGFVERIIYQNDENGYTVAELTEDGEETVIVGMLKGITKGEHIAAFGDYTEHPVYGVQFKAVEYKTVAPTNEADMQWYLASGAIRGVGEALAARIVKRFGKDTFRIIEEEPIRLSEVKGISDRIAREIASQVQEKKDMREAFLFLQKYGISNTLAVKIYNTYQDEIYRVIRENPYRLAEDVEGVGFKIADEIAAKVGIRTDSDYRIRSGILYTLSQAVAEGHMYLPESLLISRAAELLELEEAYIAPQIRNLTMDKKLVMKAGDEEANVFASGYYYAELGVARMLHNLNITMYEEGLLPAEEERIRKRIEEITKSEGLILDEWQEKAVLECVKCGVFILTGGPGTGKTTTVNTIIRYFERERLDIMLAAPTGRAAKRMTETTGYEARTIHRMLELGGAFYEEGKRAKFERNEENPLMADVIIIDEMSMVDILLFQALLRAVMPGTRLILVGDADQLPSVGPGQVLRDILKSGAFSQVCLKNVFRQAKESDIIVNAHKINRGEEIALDNKSRDFFFLERNNVQVIYKHMVQLITEKLPGYLGVTPFEIQVLTPMRKGNLGVETLNGILQQFLNPADEKKREHAFLSTLFREGDKVMQIKNNYETEWEIVGNHNIPIDSGVGVFNGDLGKILEINENMQTVLVEFDDGRRVQYPFSQAEELELAYAVTIHKSQGSEYAAVIMPLLSGPKMLFNRNLLYTGVTRAKSCVTVLGSSDTVKEMIHNQFVNRRYTALCDRIREMAPIR